MLILEKAKASDMIRRVSAYLRDWLYAENGAAVLFACLGLLVRVPIIANSMPASGAVSASFWLLSGILGLYCARNTRLEWPFFWLLLFAFYVSFMSCVSGYGSFSMLYIRLGMILGASFFAFSDRKHFLQTSFLFSVVISVLLVLDILSIVLFPGGIYDTGTGPSWILGYKNLRTDFLVLLIAICAVRYFSMRSRASLVLLIGGFVASVADLLLCDCSSGVGGLLIEAVLIAFAFLLPKKAVILRWFWLFLAVYLVIFFLLVVFRENDIVRNILALVFSKSPTLSGRTAIWDGCLFAIGETNMLGLGAITASEYFEVTGGFYNAHNLIVDLALLGGIPGVVLYFLAVGQKISMARIKNENMVLISSVYAVFIIGMVSGVFTYTAILYYLIFSIEFADGNGPHRKLLSRKRARKSSMRKNVQTKKLR